ncbi:MAG: hypothetical protein JG776_2468 [Caloramator sp.]|jgi:hypothetical protein|uniref:hypothetical protein n=1 Tax=Caloramator sp. TaxID=1871330 RepID=UPI001D8814F2|nr:hypothetical protein [Caloramator sp.]MBZ4664744.1 hypothetical protein [Caloramator sp.]
MKKGTVILLFLVVVTLLGINIFFNYKTYETFSDKNYINSDELLEIKEILSKYNENESNYIRSQNDDKIFQKSIELLEKGDILNANNYFINFIYKEKDKYQYMEKYAKSFVDALKNISDISVKINFLNDYISFLYSQYPTIESENIDNLSNLIFELENILIDYNNKIEEYNFQESETISNNQIKDYINNILEEPVNNFTEYQDRRNTINNYLYEGFTDEITLEKVNQWEEKWNNYFSIFDLIEQSKKYLEAYYNQKENNEIYLTKANELKLTLISYLPLLKANETESIKIINEFVDYYDTLLIKKEEEIYESLKAEYNEIIECTNCKFSVLIDELNNLRNELGNKYINLNSENYKIKFEELNKEINYKIQEFQKSLYNAYQIYALKNLENFFNTDYGLNFESEEAREALEKYLGDIDTNLLKQDVMMIYNEAFLKIYDKFNTEEKISASKYLLYSDKKSLDDF